MSIHVLNPELDAKIASDRRKASLASIVIGVLLMTLLATIFYLIGIKIYGKVSPVFQTRYEDSLNVDPPLDPPKVRPIIPRKPAASASSVSRVIAVTAPSSFAVSVPDVREESLSVDFGAGNDFGDSWAAGNNTGVNDGTFEGEFINTTFSGERICFVIDYSASMRGKRIELLKQELEKTVQGLPDKLEYQMIFFAGPAWIAGSEVTSGKSEATISYGNKKYQWQGQGAHHWQQVGKKQPVEWIKASDDTRESSLKAVKETALVWGTSWDAPLEMALDMKPKPDMVVFLTDGASGKDSLEKAKRLGNRAKSRGITVNAIALMEPQAREAMAELARRAGGEFALIDENGEKVQQNVEKRGGIKKHH